MKFKIPVLGLKRLFAIAIDAIPSKTTLETLYNYKLEAKAEGLWVSATNLEQGVFAFSPAEVSDPGVILVPARIITEWVNANNEGEALEAELVKKTLKIKVGRSEASFQTISADEFPPIATISDCQQTFSLALADFVHQVSGVVFACASGVHAEARPFLSGVMLSYQNGFIQIAGMDGFRVCEGLIAHETGFQGSLIIPKKAVLLATKLKDERIEFGIRGKKEQKENVISVDPGTVVMKVGDIQIASMLIEGNIPLYHDLVSKSYPVSYLMSKAELQSAFRRLRVLIEEYNRITFDFKPKHGLVLSVETPEIGTAHDDLSLQHTENAVPMKISMNLAHLSEMVSFCGETVMFELEDNRHFVKLTSPQVPNWFALTTPFLEREAGSNAG